MKKIRIIGTGGFAKEVLFLIDDINKVSEQYKFDGFISDEASPSQLKVAGVEYKVFLEQEMLSHSTEGLHLAIGIGNPKIIQKVTEKFSDFSFPNLIHPSFSGQLQGIVWGKGNIVTAGCRFTTDIQIGSFNIFNLNTTLGHDSNIGSCNVFNPGVNISGGVTIGNCNLIGTNASILQYLSIGSNSTLGASALLTKDLPDNSTFVGVPAKSINK